jgi:hypothetical protein
MEQNYIIAGPEFGQLEGHYLVSAMKASHLARQNLISG